MSAKIGSAIVALLGSAWFFLIYLVWQMHRPQMADMWMAPVGFAGWGAGDFALVFAMWGVMMAAMMLPAAVPMLSVFANYCQRDPDGSEWKTFGFIAGYLVAWLLFSLASTLLQWLFHGWVWLSPMMENRQPLMAAMFFFLAGAYQFTAFKQACLHHCRTPLGFLLSHWQPGVQGAIRIGYRHGLTCVGCCWAQMLTMFSIGVMDLLWMSLLTLLVIVEKWAPLDPRKLGHGIGVAFLICGCYSLWQVAV